jgi:hypothetical protein
VHLSTNIISYMLLRCLFFLLPLASIPVWHSSGCYCEAVVLYKKLYSRGSLLYKLVRTTRYKYICMLSRCSLSWQRFTRTRAFWETWPRNRALSEESSRAHLLPKKNLLGAKDSHEDPDCTAHCRASCFITLLHVPQRERPLKSAFPPSLILPRPQWLSLHVRKSRISHWYHPLLLRGNNGLDEGF